MTKFLSKWFRKFHRWIAVPTGLLILIAATIKLAGDPQLVAAWNKFDKLPSVLMLVMAVSGIYLFLLPYIVKGQRNKRMETASRGAKSSAMERGQLTNHEESVT
ncbi:MAG: hypothetical protein IT316_09230 [Anaerolineales bacterium]|nr:hypothetical protein [Anaerolineales bacterium]